MGTAYAFLLSAVALCITVLCGYSVYRTVESGVSGRKWLTTVLSIVGIAAAVTAFSNAWTPINSLIIGACAKINGIHPLAPAITIAAIIGISIIMLFRPFVQKGLSKTNAPAWLAKTIDFFLLSLWVYAATDLIGIADNQNDIWWLFWHIVIILYFAYFGYRLISNWYPDGQNRWGLPATYLIDLAMTAILGSIFGYYVKTEMMGSLIFVGPFLCFNLLVFWLSYGIGRPTKDMKKRPAYYIVFPWTFLLCVCFLFVILLQGTHKLTKYEITTARTLTKYRLLHENQERGKAFCGFGQTVKDADQALADNDTAALEKTLRELESYDSKQRNIKRTVPVLPQGVEDCIDGLFSKIMSADEKKGGMRTKRWETVAGYDEKPFIGIGYTGGEYGGGGISIAESGKDCRFGDKITIKGNNFEVWDYGKWNPHSENFSFINVIKAPGGKTGARAPEGVPFAVKIERPL